MGFVCLAIYRQLALVLFGLVRAWTIATTGAKKGSDGDVQQDIHQWFEDLLKLKRNRAIADLSDAVGAAARDFWRLAVDAANDALADERETLAKEKTIAGRDDAIQRLEQSLSEMRATLQAKDERIAGLSAELARKAGEHAVGLTELNGLRKHSLLQIEQARGEARLWKAEFERVDGENKTSVQQYRSKTRCRRRADGWGRSRKRWRWNKHAVRHWKLRWRQRQPGQRRLLRVRSGSGSGSCAPAIG